MPDTRTPPSEISNKLMSRCDTLCHFFFLFQNPALKVDSRDGARRIAQQYRWVLTRAFATWPDAPAVVVAEDDFLFSPDFLEFFSATAPLLEVGVLPLKKDTPHFVRLPFPRRRRRRGAVAGDPGAAFCGAGGAAAVEKSWSVCSDPTPPSPPWTTGTPCPHGPAPSLPPWPRSLPPIPCPRLLTAPLPFCLRACQRDPTTFVLSAWNDNGLRGKVRENRCPSTWAHGGDFFVRCTHSLSPLDAPAPQVRDPRALCRTGFFPGLGWLLPRRLFEAELLPKWPKEHWDHWMRDVAQHRGREAVYPEVPVSLSA